MTDPSILHTINWTPDKVSAFWSFVSSNVAAQDQYFGKHAGRAVIETIRPFVPLHGRVVDYGCGPGFFLEHLLNQGVACEGIDFSRESLELAKRRLGEHPLFQGVIHAVELPVPLESQSVDVLFFLETIEHLLPDQIAPTLAELARLMRPGGTIVVTTRHNENLAENTVVCPDCGGSFHRWQHISSFTVERLMNVMREHGFETMVCKATLFCKDSRLVRALMSVAKRLRREPLPDLLFIGRRRV